MDLEQAAARYSLRYPGDTYLDKRLHEIATDALVQGLDSPSLRILAGEYNPYVPDLYPLFEKCLQELGIEIPEPLDAAMFLIRLEAQKILSGEVTPHSGARTIVDYGSLSGSDGDIMFDRIRVFYAILDDLDELNNRTVRAYYGEEKAKEMIEKFEHEIVKEAKKFLEKTF